jgi:hypothetical protein
MCVCLTKQQELAAHTQPECTTPHTTLTTSTHNPPIMASSSSVSDWECGACASSNKGDKYCTMCATPCPKHQAPFAVLMADVAAHAAVVAAPAVVSKVIPSAPIPGAVIGAPAAVAAVPVAVAKMNGAVVGAPAPVAKKAKAQVAREAKVWKECAPATADVAVPVEVVATPTPVAKAKVPNESAPGPFHPTGVLVKIVGTEMGDQGRSCEEQANNCGKMMAKDVVVRHQKVQIIVEGREKTAIAAYWVTDGIKCLEGDGSCRILGDGWCQLLPCWFLPLPHGEACCMR